MSNSLSWGRWHVTLSSAVICLSFNLLEYLWPSTILQTYMINYKFKTLLSFMKTYLVGKRIDLHRQIVWPLSISHLQTRPLGVLNNKPVGLLEVFHHRFHCTPFINRKSETTRLRSDNKKTKLKTKNL